MKNLLIATFLLTSISAFAGPKDIECSNLKGFLRPTNALAIKVTKNFGVKTCDRSEAFKNAVKAKGLKIIVVNATKAQIAEFGQSKTLAKRSLGL